MVRRRDIRVGGGQVRAAFDDVEELWRAGEHFEWRYHLMFGTLNAGKSERNNQPQ